MRRDLATTNHKRKIERGATTSQQSPKLTIPYYFSDIARRRQENIEIGDFVRVQGLEKKYRLINLYPQFGSVRVRAVGDIEAYVFPWTGIKPWEGKDETSKTAFRAVLGWLFSGTEVYLLSEPDRVLKTLRINWDEQTTDLQDEAGNVFYGVPWTDLEFLRPQDYHIPEDD